MMSVELMPKRLQLLGELVPGAKTCAVLINPRNPGIERATTAVLQDAASGLGITLEIISARSESELETAFTKIAALKADVLLVTTDPLFTGTPRHLVALAARHAVPTSYPWREFVLAGGLISYGPSLAEAYRQSGYTLARFSPAKVPSQSNLPTFVTLYHGPQPTPWRAA